MINRNRRRRLNKKQKKQLRIVFYAVLAVLAFISILLCLYVFKQDRIQEVEKEDIPKREENLEEEDASEGEQSVSGNEADTSDFIEYPEPEYDFEKLKEEVYIEIKDLSKEYTIVWVSDLHLITDHKPGSVSEGSMVEINKRYNNLSVSEDGVHAEDMWPDIVDFINYGVDGEAYDAVIFGGDLMDYCSISNMNIFRDGYDKLRPDMKKLYIRSDHDYGGWYVGDGFTQNMIHDLHCELDGDEPKDKYLDFEEFLIVGINESNKNMPLETLEWVQRLYGTGKPVIAVTHVPYPSEVDGSLKELSMAVRNTEYYWTGEIYRPDEETEKYFSLIYKENTCVKYVLAGHLHATWEGNITNQVREHIFGPAFEGRVGVIHIVPEGSVPEDKKQQDASKEAETEDLQKKEKASKDISEKNISKKSPEEDASKQDVKTEAEGTEPEDDTSVQRPDTDISGNNTE